MDEVILTGEDFYKKKDRLKEIFTDNYNWLIYYLDENSDEKWVQEYPHSAMHGGGPPQLRLIEDFPPFPSDNA